MGAVWEGSASARSAWHPSLGLVFAPRPPGFLPAAAGGRDWVLVMVTLQKGVSSYYGIRRGGRQRMTEREASPARPAGG